MSLLATKDYISKQVFPSLRDVPINIGDLWLIHLKEKLLSLRAARAVSVQQSQNVWLQMELALLSRMQRTPPLLPLWSRRLNQQAEKLLRSRQTPPLQKLSSPRLTRQSP